MNALHESLGIGRKRMGEHVVYNGCTCTCSTSSIAQLCDVLRSISLPSGVVYSHQPIYEAIIGESSILPLLYRLTHLLEYW